APVPAPPAQPPPSGVEALDAIASAVEHVEVSGPVNRQSADRPEASERAEEGAGGGEPLHDVAELVAHVDRPVPGDGDCLRAAQHAVCTVADHAYANGRDGLTAGRASRQDGGKDEDEDAARHGTPTQDGARRAILRQLP